MSMWQIWLLLGWGLGGGAPQNGWLSNRRFSRRILRHVKFLPGQAMVGEELARSGVWPGASRSAGRPERSGCSHSGGGLRSVSGCGRVELEDAHITSADFEQREPPVTRARLLEDPGSPRGAVFPFFGCRDLHLSGRSAQLFATSVVAQRGCGWLHRACGVPVQPRPLPQLRLRPPLSLAACWAVGKNQSLPVLEGGRKRTGFWISCEHCLPSPRNTKHTGPMQTARSCASA